MAKYKKKSRRSGKSKISLISLAPIAVVGGMAASGYAANGARGAMSNAVLYTTGVDIASGKFHPEFLVPIATSMVAAYAMKKVVSFTGANRALKGMPFRL
jgi:hypothetical protein